jgi:hypothetical protein
MGAQFLLQSSGELLSVFDVLVAHSPRPDEACRRRDARRSSVGSSRENEPPC